MADNPDTYSILEALDGLEELVKVYAPRCVFYLGDEDKNRDASPPKIIWDIDGGDPVGEEGRTGRPRAYGADEVLIAAKIVGEGKISATAKTQRRADFESSEHLLRVLEGAVKSSGPKGWHGRSFRRGWTSISPEGPSDRGWPIEVQFVLRIACLQPKPPEVQPETFVQTPIFEGTS